MKFNPDDVIGFEPMNLVYSRSKYKNSDIIFVKENVHLKDGSKQTNTRIIKNYERPFWITNKGARDHVDKLQWEKQENLREYQSTQWELASRIHRALQLPGFDRGLMHELSSPYVYGANISPTALLRKQYRTKFPNAKSPKADVAILDTETNVVDGSQEVILISLTIKEKVFLGIRRDFLKSSKQMDEIERQRVLDKLNYYLSEHIEKRNIKFEIFFGDTSGELCHECLQAAHKWRPDFVAIWNMDFDISKMEMALRKDGFDPADSFCDPTVPREYRKFKYHPGPTMKVTHSGSKRPLSAAEKWPTTECVASFFIIDAMCLYGRLRTASGKEPSYALDAILKKNIKMGKLKFTATDHLDKLQWHIVMQRDYPYEYIAYNVFDCIGVELLDEKTGDISSAFIPQCEDSDWQDFNSGPTQIADGMHFHCLENGYVAGTVGGDLRTELDNFVVGPKGWIVTLGAYLAQDIGINLIKDLPHKQTMATIHNADLDIEGTYPSIQEKTNACRGSAIREIASIEGLSEYEKRLIGVNLSAGVVNSCAISEKAFKLGAKDKLLDVFMKENF